MQSTDAKTSTIRREFVAHGPELPELMRSRLHVSSPGGTEDPTIVRDKNLFDDFTSSTQTSRARY